MQSRDDCSFTRRWFIQNMPSRSRFIHEDSLRRRGILLYARTHMYIYMYRYTRYRISMRASHILMYYTGADY